MKVRDIIAVLDEFAPEEIQEKWDNSGLQISSPDQEVHGVLIALDCTVSLVREALSRGCDMLVTHHPLIFGGLRSIRPEDPVGAAVIEAVKGGVAVYSAHTNADKVPDGVSGAMAKRLGLTNLRILHEDAPGVGLGVVGDLPLPLPSEEALELVKRAFGLPVLRHSRPVEGPVSTVALCGGSGSSLIEDAIAAGAQMYVCGDISYHHFFAPQGIMLADAGHFETEVDIVEIFYGILRKKFPTFALLISQDIKTANPVRYKL